MDMERDALLACFGATALLIASVFLRVRARSERSDKSVKVNESITEGSVEAPAAEILGALCRFNPVTVEGMPSELHYLAPHIPKVKWTALGDLIASRERGTSGSIDGSRWISLRLDGSGFSKAVRKLRSQGVLEPGFSPTFANAMVTSLEGLMEHFGAKLGYTQSDEMVIFIPPAGVVRGEQQCHDRNGRVAKLTTLASSFVTARFLMALSRSCLSKEVGLDGLTAVLPHFDCRAASWASWDEARALLMWRAYDCSVNGVSDAVYQIQGSGKRVQSLGKREKVAWLWQNGHLPLPRHQAYGSVLARTRRVVDGHNPKTGEATRALRRVIERVDGPVLELMRTGKLFPEEDQV